MTWRAISGCWLAWRHVRWHPGYPLMAVKAASVAMDNPLRCPSFLSRAEGAGAHSRHRGERMDKIRRVTSTIQAALARWGTAFRSKKPSGALLTLVPTLRTYLVEVVRPTPAMLSGTPQRNGGAKLPASSRPPVASPCARRRAAAAGCGRGGVGDGAHRAEPSSWTSVSPCQRVRRALVLDLRPRGPQSTQLPASAQLQRRRGMPVGAL